VTTLAGENTAIAGMIRTGPLVECESSVTGSRVGLCRLLRHRFFERKQMRPLASLYRQGAELQCKCTGRNWCVPAKKTSDTL
jgi:hypothetical protein